MNLAKMEESAKKALGDRNMGIPSAHADIGGGCIGGCVGDGGGSGGSCDGSGGGSGAGDGSGDGGGY